MGDSTKRRLLGLVAVVALVAQVGCGARWTDEQEDIVAARDNGEAQDAGSASAAPRSPSSSDAGAGAIGPTTTRGSSGSADDSSAAARPAGASGAPAGGDAASAQSGSGAAPCTAPSDAPGVTDTTIRVGNISTLTGPSPGIGASAQSAAQAYVAYLNSTGGVCGRQVELLTADDGYDNARHRAIVSDFAPKVLGIAGGLATGDGGSANLVVEQNIPVVSLPTADSFEAAATVFDMNPPYADPNRTIEKYRYLKGNGVTKAALVYPGIDQARSQMATQRRHVKAAGIEVVADIELPLSTLNYDSAARSVANSGAQYMFFIHDPGASASMSQSLDGIDYDLAFEEYLTAYGSDFIELAGAAGEGDTSWIRTLPQEEAGSNAELDLYLQWLGRVAPSAVADTFAADSWVASKAFFDAVKALPGPISRDALLAQLRGTGSYDAGGMLGTIELGPKHHNGCYMAMIVKGGRWTRLVPDSGFMC